jgi:VanZ family protein
MEMMNSKTEIVKKAVKYVSAVAILVLMAKLFVVADERKKEYDKTRTASICPALLSISRSARDTLIVMKAEPLCNNYVLANLK